MLNIMCKNTRYDIIEHYQLLITSLFLSDFKKGGGPLHVKYFFYY